MSSLHDHAPRDTHAPASSSGPPRRALRIRGAPRGLSLAAALLVLAASGGCSAFVGAARPARRSCGTWYVPPAGDLVLGAAAAAGAVENRRVRLEQGAPLVGSDALTFGFAAAAAGFLASAVYGAVATARCPERR